MITFMHEHTSSVAIVQEKVREFTIKELNAFMDMFMSRTSTHLALSNDSVSELQARIEAGIEKLNTMQHGRAWWDDIDLERLNMTSPSDCVLGQVYGNFFRAPLIEQPHWCNMESIDAYNDAVHCKEWYEEAHRCAFILYHSKGNFLWRKAIQILRSTHVQRQRQEQMRRILAARIEYGLRLLDKMVGYGWEDRIDLDMLSIAHPRRCILGQLYGEYFAAPALSPDGDVFLHYAEKAGLDGFCTDATSMWREAIAHRRATQSGCTEATKTA